MVIQRKGSWQRKWRSRLAKVVLEPENIHPRGVEADIEE